MKRLTLALSAASLALLGASAVNAEDRPEGGPRAMDMAKGMDSDHPMTWAEFKAHADEGFARIDANHDGVIDKSEREAMRDRMRNRRGSEAGHGPDGSPPPPPGEMGPGGGHPDGPRPGRGMAGMGMGMGGGMGAMMLLRGADTDHDGKITRAEYDASVKMHFDAMDTNHDGQISREERQAAHEKLRAEMEARMRDRAGNERGKMGGDMDGMHQGPGGDDMPPPAQ
jgi:Ca2+-binding EF-hand superfamily protein